MAGLAEDSLATTTSWPRRLGVLAAVLLVLALVGAAGWWLKTQLGAPAAPKRQTAKVSILPDTPSPPPPPPREPPKEPPKQEPKQVMREDQPKPAAAPKPANEPLKMEGAAGEGPSAFAAGSVANDYKGGAVNTGPAVASAPQGGTASDRAQERFYANSARQLLRDAIERHLKSEASQATATFSVWVDREGTITRHELVGTGDARLDGELNAALDDTARALKLPPPPAVPQPMKFRLTVRPLG